MDTKTITMADVICKGCGFPATLQDGLCEFCRKANRTGDPFTDESPGFPWLGILVSAVVGAFFILGFWLITAK